MNKLASLLIAGIILALFVGASWLITRDAGTGQAPAAPAAAAPVPAGGQPPAAPYPEGDKLQWSKRCNDQQPPHCELFQRLAVRETGQRLIEVGLGYPADSEQAQLGMILPLGIAVSEGVRLNVDDSETGLSMPVHSCGGDGCVAIGMIDDAFVQEMRLGKILAVTMVDGRGQKIRIQLSLEDFSAQFSQLR